MPKAIWNGKVIAETDQHEIVEGNECRLLYSSQGGLYVDSDGFHLRAPAAAF